MQLNKVLKGLLIAIPVMALTACGSTSGRDSGNAGDTNGNGDNSQVQTTDNTNNNNVEVSTMTREEELAEIKRKKQESLRQEHTIYFEYDKNNVEYQFNDMLGAHAEFLVKNPGVRITIEGHCDERGTPEYNIALGERRAKSVAKYLTTLGVSNGQISIVSYGEEKPANKSRTESGFAKNRRAILVY
jgi:peptidoglycan-associated lipoprotein